TGRLSHGAAPSLPDFYLKAVNGTPVGMGMGSCGEAAFTAKRVIAEDILIHPNWKNFTSIAVDKAGLRACWSEPVIGSDSKVLGTFAIYYRHPQSPKKEDIELIRSAAYIASIAIEYSMSREQLKQANEELEHRVIERTKELRLRITEKEQVEIALRKSHEALSESQRMAKLGSWNLDLNTQIITLSVEHQFVAGRKCKETALPLDEYTADYIVEEDIAIIQDQLAFAVQNIENSNYHNNFEYRLKTDNDGGYKNIAVQIRFKSKGIINGVIQDITERKQAEEALKTSRENLLEESNQRKILSKRLIDLLEKDRHEIAMELHDNIGQILASLKIYLEIVDDKLKPIDTELGSLTKAAIKRANQAINDLNYIAQGLMPSILDALGLVSSLRALLNEFREHTNIKIDFFNRNIGKRFDKEKELAIYRIVQEALNNIIKHAKAKTVYVSLLKKGNVLSLSVEDDGVGFDQHKAMKISKGKGSLGLVIMQERALQLDGELTIESLLGK
ncbi:MAG: GAF domain-containing protein, partial [Desulfobacterales bacterium]